MDIAEATQSYERWLAGQTAVVTRDLQAKHAAMAETPFTLLRATFYRWMQLWSEHAGDLAAAPKVLAVGDLHVENFGTWRDSEGRLIWGINDFDEAYPLPFTVDLVRLSTSAHLAIAESNLSVTTRESCEAILDGYREGLATGGRPFVLSERNTWLWRMTVSELRNPKRFWQEQDEKCAPPRKRPPKELVRIVQTMLPKDTGPFRLLHRVAGKGSLGRQRYLFRVDWRGGTTAREAKALVPSAYIWARGLETPRLHCNRIIQRAVRCPDPFIRVWESWMIRRLAPDCSKIDLAHLPRGRDESKLLWAMGFETANIHLGTLNARPRIRKFLRTLSARRLDQASNAMAGRVRADLKAWRAFHA